MYRAINAGQWSTFPLRGRRERWNPKHLYRALALSSSRNECLRIKKKGGGRGVKMSIHAEKVGINMGRKMPGRLTESSVICDIRTKFPC